ncbi:MAG TPA: hypothetical protein VK974_03510 [Methylophilaceae bacterium]|nr:hypothetical protein [Methylophilaceae bacterium]
MNLTFEYFHPLTGDPPDYIYANSVEILLRARRLIKHRAYSEVESILEIINGLDSETSVSTARYQLVQKNADLVDRPYLMMASIGNIFSPLFALKRYQQHHMDLPLSGISNLQWHELYAVLGLALFSQAVHKGANQASQDKAWQTWNNLGRSSPEYLEAVEAITIAEGLNNAQIMFNQAQEKISLRNQTAANLSHAKTNAAILEIAQMMGSAKFKSMRNAAQIYCEKNPDKIAHLAPYNAIRTLTEGLSAYLKGHRKSLQPQKIIELEKTLKAK